MVTSSKRSPLPSSPLSAFFPLSSLYFLYQTLCTGPVSSARASLEVVLLLEHQSIYIFKVPCSLNQAVRLSSFRNQIMDQSFLATIFLNRIALHYLILHVWYFGGWIKGVHSSLQQIWPGQTRSWVHAPGPGALLRPPAHCTNLLHRILCTYTSCLLCINFMMK